MSAPNEPMNDKIRATVYAVFAELTKEVPNMTEEDAKKWLTIHGSELLRRRVQEDGEQ